MNGATGSGGHRSAVDAGSAVDGIVVELRRLTRAADHYRRSVHAGTGLTASELTALGALVDHGPLRAVDVGAATRLTPGSVTALLDRLESRDLVRRQRPAGDRRVLSVEATAEGRAVLATVTGPVRGVVARLVADGGHPDCLRRGLADLATGLEGLDGTAVSSADAGSGT